MKKFYIGTNFKMTKTTSESVAYAQELLEIYKKIDASSLELFIIPSYPSLFSVHHEIAHTNIHLGAQNMHWEERGAYTGEVSPLMLQEAGVKIVELGHSERRQYYNENDEELNKKVLTALQFNMQPLLCIGETLEDKQNNLSIETLSRQLKIGLKNIAEGELSRILIAYEPVWAIGEQGIPASIEYVSAIHMEIKRILVSLFGKQGNSIPVLYGGSVNLENYYDYFKDENVDGLFIGRAAWDLKSFEEILKKCSEELLYKESGSST